MSLLTLAVLLFAGSALVTSKRIVGGEDTTIETYPSIVQVDFYTESIGEWSQSCGANILLKDWVLSAAHCFQKWGYKPENRRIRAGSTYRNKGGVIHYIDYEINHPEYGVIARNEADITVVKLSTPLVWTPVIQRATIVTQDYVLPDNSHVTHVGWGHTSKGGENPKVLQRVDLFSINNEVCRRRYSSSAIVTPNMICVGLLDIGGRGACNGDSGGPLYAGGVVVGLVAWGRGCAQAEFPGVTTRVASYTDWIVRTVRS